MFLFRFCWAIISGLLKLFFIFALGIGILGSAESLLDTAHNRYNKEFLVAVRHTESHDLKALKNLSRSVHAKLSKLY